MRVVINDANILIDLIKLDLLSFFFQLSHWEVKTTDFVFEELHPEQKEALRKFVDLGTFEILESNEDNLFKISILLSKTSGLSFEDCSVWYYAKTYEGILLTGDGNLRKQSSKDGIEVRGILHVFDQLLLSGLISFNLAITKLNRLYIMNDRLPKNAKNQRIECWSRSEHFE